MLIARPMLWTLTTLALSACEGRPHVPIEAPAPERQLRRAIATTAGLKKAELELRLAEVLLPGVPQDASATVEVPSLLADAERLSREASPRLWAETQVVFGRYWLESPRLSPEERLRRVQDHLERAESMAGRGEPADRARLHASLGMVRMQLSRTSNQPSIHFERAREHFTRAQEMWRSVKAEAESEAMAHLIRRADEERRMP